MILKNIMKKLSQLLTAKYIDVSHTKAKIYYSNNIIVLQLKRDDWSDVPVMLAINQLSNFITERNANPLIEKCC